MSAVMQIKQKGNGVPYIDVLSGLFDLNQRGMKIFQGAEAVLEHLF